MIEQGRILEVSIMPNGSELAADAASAATSIIVEDAFDFNATGGTLDINGQQVAYTGWDETTNTITLSAGLAGAATAGDRVAVIPRGQSKWAMVQFDDGDEGIKAILQGAFAGAVDVGIRDEQDQERVFVSDDKGRWEVVALDEEMPTIGGTQTNGSGGSEPVPITAPVHSPLILKTTGTTSTVILEMELVQPGATVDIHMSTSEFFTGDDTTWIGNAGGQVFVADQLPGGGQLDKDTEYYFATVATNSLGQAPQSPSVVGKLDLRSVDALIAAKLIVGFVLAGTISVGQITIDSVLGITVNRAGGGYLLKIPCDGVSPIEAVMQIVTDKLNVIDNLSIGGAAQLNGEMQMGNGITNPTSKPGLSFRYNYKLIDGIGDGTTDVSNIFRGMVEDPGNANNIVMPINFFGAGLRFVNRYTGALAYYPDPTTGKAWTTNFYPWGGITYLSGYYYVFGSDNDRSPRCFLYKIDATTFNKVDEKELWDWVTWGTAYPCLGTDGTDIFIFYVNGVKDMKYRKINPNLTASSWSAITDLGVAVSARRAMGGAVYGSIDGIGSARWWITMDGGTDPVYCFNAGLTARSSTYDFLKAVNGNIGIIYNATNSHMETMDRQGGLWGYGKYPTSKSIKGEEAWLDDNATGGTHETMPGPVNTYTLPARACLEVSADVPPDYANTDALNTDKANKTAIYLSDDGGTTWHRVVFDGSEDWAVIYETLSGIGTATPKATNEFLGSTLATPGRLFSTAQNPGATKAIVDIKGSGYAHFLKTLQAGLEATGTFAGTGSGNAKTINVSFDVPFDSAPAVDAQPVIADAANCECTVTGITSSGFTISVYRNSGTAGFNIYWKAVARTQ